MRWPAALIVTDCTFTANAAPWNATAGLDHLHYSSGGAIYVDRTTALVYYSLFRENTAAGHGGAIALVGDGRDTSYLRVQSSKFNENEGRLASAIYVYRGDSYFKSNKVYEDRIPQTFALGFNATAYGCHNDELNITAGEEAFAYCDADSSSGINVVEALVRAAKGCEIPNFKGSYLGRFPLVLADFWTSDHLSERSRSVDAFFGNARARNTHVEATLNHPFAAQALDPREVAASAADAPTPFGVIFVHGRRFDGFHVRFRPIARGGARLVTPRSAEAFAHESSPA